MGRIVLVANPTSGKGKGKRLLPRAVAAFRALGLDHEVIVTTDGGHPERAAREAAASGASVVAALGGDGLVGACANALIGTDTALAIIPAGSGNDFARNLGLDRKRPLNAIPLIAEDVARPIDAAYAEGPGWARHFICVAGSGFDSDANEVANELKRLSGTLRYIVATFRTLISFRPAEFTLRIDGEEHRMEAMMVAIGNARSYGGGMNICPDAILDDGLLDVTIVGAVSKPTFLRVFPRVFKGTHVTHPAVSTYRGAKIEVEASRPFTAYADGERFGELPVTYTVVPKALRVVAP